MREDTELLTRTKAVSTAGMAIGQESHAFSVKGQTVGPAVCPDYPALLCTRISRISKVSIKLLSHGWRSDVATGL